MKKVRKVISSFLCTALIFCAVPAFAEETAAVPDLEVEYNGEAIVFTDAEPCIVNSRTYVPFRAVFEAMGADSIEYEAPSRTVTAVRDGVTVKMQVGKSEIQITKDGKTTTEAIDAATFIKNGRTYVPARFAAQALDCQVGWDADVRTVVIMDKNKLLKEIKGQFSLLKKYNDYAVSFSEQYPAYSGTLSLAMSVQDEDQPLKLKGVGEIKGKTSDLKSIANSSIKMDWGDVEKYLKEQPDWDSESQKMMDAFKDFTVDVVVDTKDGIIYCSGSFLSDLMGLKEDTWFSLNLKEFLSGIDIGSDFSDIFSMSGKDFDFEAFLTNLLNGVNIDDSVSAETAVEVVTIFKELLSDSAFEKVGNDYVSEMKESDSETGLDMNLSFTLKGDAAGNIKGYGISLTLKVEEGLDLSLNAGQSGQDVTCSISVDLPELLQMTMDGKFRYAKSISGTLREPTASSHINDISQLTDSPNIGEIGSGR